MSEEGFVSAELTGHREHMRFMFRTVHVLRAVSCVFIEMFEEL